MSESPNIMKCFSRDDDNAIGILPLKEAVRLLALPASEQLALLPDFVCKPDELALTFDQWFDWLYNRAAKERGRC